MKKTTILGLSALCMGAMVFAQQGRVGVNTETPQATLDIAKLSNPDEGQVEGVLFPRLTKAQRDAMQNVPNGTMIFNTTKNCIDWYDGSFWQCLDGTQQDTKPFVSPKTITLHSAKKFISSIYDNNYQPYTAPTTPATWDRDVAPNGDVTNETPVIDFQGVLTTAGLRIKIPVTATANGTLPAYADNYVVPAEHTEDGVSRVVNLSWPEQAYTTSTKFIVATKMKKALHSIAPQQDEPTKGNIVLDIADDSVGCTYEDLVNLKDKCDAAEWPEEGRRLVLCNKHWNALLKDRKNFGDQLINYKTGEVSPVIAGFEIKKYIASPHYKADKTKKAFGEVAGSGDKPASVAFVLENTAKKTGITKQYFSEAGKDPENQANLLSYRHYFIATAVEDKWRAALI